MHGGGELLECPPAFRLVAEESEHLPGFSPKRGEPTMMWKPWMR
jgi:hypothetical protein